MWSIIKSLLIVCLSVYMVRTQAQGVLTLQEALELASINYGPLKSKAHLTESAEQSLAFARTEYFPNIVLSAQQVYGTVNGQNGPAYGFGGFGVSSSGLPLPDQNWNAAFGGL